MGVLSKFFGHTLGMKLLTANCYETCHTWNPDCSAALIDSIPDALRFCFKTYFSLYLATSLIKVKNPLKVDLRLLLRDTLRSSIFLTANLLGYVFWLCRLRKMMGFFIWPSMGLFNGFLSSFFAIFLEQKERRGTLALYLTNLASETAFRMLINFGILRPIAHGEFLILSTALAGYFFMLRKKLLHEKTVNIFRMIFALNSADDILPVTRKFPDFIYRKIHQLRQFGGPKHILCLHKYNCTSAVLESFVRNFASGYAISVAMKFFRSFGQLLKTPRHIFTILSSYGTFQFPLFVAFLPAFFHTSQCTFHRIFNRDNALLWAASGAISGCAMLLYPNISLAMYILWKWIETVYLNGVKSGLLPSWQYGDVLLYTISTGFVLFCGCIQPQSLRQGYRNFLCALTGDRSTLFNRSLMNVFGFDSNQMDRTFRPLLDSRFTTISNLQN